MHSNLIFDKPESNCGIFGIFKHNQASTLTYYGLLALQHRGQEASGIVTSFFDKSKNNVTFNLRKGKGLVSEVFNDEKIFTDELKGDSAIGHNRYSTTGSNILINVQPFVVKYKSGNLAISHNGNLTNARILRGKLIEEGAIFQTSSDTEVILHLISRSKFENQTDQIFNALNQVTGAYSLLILTDNNLYACRDPYGVRPLCIGKYEDSYVFASETCAFDLIGAEYLREVEPGEIVFFNIKNNQITLKSIFLDNKQSKSKKCIFEFIYFSRPDSVVFNENVDKIRRQLGKRLAEENPVNSTNEKKLAIISVPDSSNTIAIGYNDQLRKMNYNCKFEIGLIRSHYIGRTFIQSEQNKREFSTRIKYNIVRGVLKERDVVVVDDSIVRGTTSRQLINLLKEGKPNKIHFRVASPPILFPCQYGMDFPSREELIANKHNGDISKIKKELEVDSLEYLSFEGLISCTPEKSEEFYCTACFTGKYPIPIDNDFHKDQNES